MRSNHFRSLAVSLSQPPTSLHCNSIRVMSRQQTRLNSKNVVRNSRVIRHCLVLQLSRVTNLPTCVKFPDYRGYIIACGIIDSTRRMYVSTPSSPPCIRVSLLALDSQIQPPPTIESIAILRGYSPFRKPHLPPWTRPEAVLN